MSMEDIFNLISSSIPNAVPSFVRDQYDLDCRRLLQQIDERFRNVEISLMLTSVDKYLQYTVGENSHLDLQLIETLIPIAKKLWFISMYNIVVDLNKISIVLYQDPPEMEIIDLFEVRLTLKLRIRSLKLLNTILDSFLHYIPSLWEKGSSEKLEFFNQQLDFIRIEVILKAFEYYFGLYYTNRIAVSYSKRRTWITCVVRMSSIIRRIWINRRDIGEYLLSYLFDKNRLELKNSTNVYSDNKSGEGNFVRPLKVDLQKESERCEIFYKFRIVLLICPNVTLYDHLLNGNLFRWWEAINGEIVTSWNPMFIIFFFRAAKYGWSNGTCLCPHFKTRIPVIFNILYNSFNLPNKPKVTKYKEIMPGEYTCLLNKSMKLFKKASKFLVLILHPTDGFSNTCDVSSDPNNNDCKCEFPLMNNKDLLTNGLSKNLFIEGLGENREDTFDYINRLINSLYPYTHPSNSGKWSLNISLFVNNLVLAYSRRIIRERSMISGMYDKRLVCLDKFDDTDTQPNTHMDVEHTENTDDELRSMDLRFCGLMFGVSMQGMFSKNIQICNNYEETIKRICYICPEDFLVPTVDKIMECCNIVNEPNQLLGSLRLFTHLTPLIVKYLPNVVTEILHILLPFISLSEPFITTQSLILISLLLSYIDTKTFEKSKCKIRNAVNNAVIESFLPKTENGLKIHENNDSEREMCLRCTLNRNLFRCNIVKKLDFREIKQKLLNNNSNYIDMIKFLENYCLCGIKDKRPLDPTNKEELDKREDLRKIVESTEQVILTTNKMIEETLNEWSIVYFENILQLCSNSCKINLKGSSLMNTVEVSTFLLIRSSLLNLLTKLNHDTLVVIISKLIRFVNDYSYKLDIVKYAVSITSCLSYVDPNLVLHQTFNYIQQNLETSFNESRIKSKNKDGSKINNFQKEGDNRLLWYLNCFISVLRYGNINTIKYKETIIKLVRLGLSDTSKQVFKLTGKLVYRYCHSLYHIYPLSKSSVNQTTVSEKSTTKHLSQDPFVNNDKLVGPNWHLPTFQEKKTYQEFMLLLVEEIHNISSVLLHNKVGNLSSNLTKDVLDSGKTVDESQNKVTGSQDELTIYNRINRIVILSKYLIKSVLLVNLNTNISSESVDTDNCDFGDFTSTILKNTGNSRDSLSPGKGDRLVDNFKIRELVERFVISKMIRIHSYLEEKDLVLDSINEKMTKLISFMVSNDFYTNEMSGNNLEALFSSLNRKVTINTSITSTKPLVKYLSFYQGVNNKSYLQDVNEVAYSTMVQDYYHHFINLMRLNPRTNHFNTRNRLNSQDALLTNNKLEPLEHLEADEEEVVESLSQLTPYGAERENLMGRQLIDLLITKMCLNNYKTVSNNAQQILKNIMMIYGNTKYYIINGLLNNLNSLLDASFSKNETTHQPMEVDSEQVFADTNENGTEKDNQLMLEQILENILLFFDSTVLNYIIVNIGLLEKFLVFMMQVISASKNKDLLMNKYDLLFIHYLNLREQPFNSESHQEEVEQSDFNCGENTANDNINNSNYNSDEDNEDNNKDQNDINNNNNDNDIDLDVDKDAFSHKTDKLNSRLKPVKLSHKRHIQAVKSMLKKLGTFVVNHWRSKLYYCALLLAYNLQLKEQSFFTKFFLEMCQDSTNHFVIAVSLQGLMVVLESVNEGVGTLTVPETVSPASSMERELKKKVLSEDLLDQEILKRVFKSLVYSNHENIINSNNTGTAANSTVTSMGYNMVVNLIKFDRTWPRNRITGNSKVISRHNFSLSYQYFKYIINERGLPGIDFLFDVLSELSETPQSYPENHISFIEIVGGLLKCSLELGDDANVELWNKLHPILKKELNNILLDRAVDYMDIMRLVLQKVYRLNRNVTMGIDDRKVGTDLCFKYVFNFLLNFEVNPTQYQGENVLLLENKKEDVTGYNLIIIKQLKLFQALVQEYKHDALTYLKKFALCEDENKSEQLVFKLLEVLLNNMFNDSQKIRDEISYIVSYLLSMCRDEILVKMIDDHIKTKFIETELETNSKQETRRVKGMLDLLNTLYTLSVPESRLENSNLHLEFSLKYVSSEKVGVSESANKTVVNIVNNFNQYDQDKIFGLMAVLVKNVKNNNKVKYISLQLLDTLFKNYCMYVDHVKVVGLLVNNYIYMLNDTTIREAAKNNLTTIILTLNEHCYQPFISLFRSFINNYSTKGKEVINNNSVQERQLNHQGGENGRKENLVLGVYGFISLISTAPYHIPNWMPNVLVELARCGGSKYPLDVRNVVQKTLQEFFKTHVDAWEQIHSNKFTRDQLELLNTYKGCPIYFN